MFWIGAWCQSNAVFLCLRCKLVVSTYPGRLQHLADLPPQIRNFAGDKISWNLLASETSGALGIDSLTEKRHNLYHKQINWYAQRRASLQTPTLPLKGVLLHRKAEWCYLVW